MEGNHNPKEGSMLEAINKVRELQGEHGALRKRELLRKYKDDDNFCKLLCV